MFEKKSIKEIAKLIKTGKTPPSKESKYFGGEINWYTPGDLNKSKFLKKSLRSITQIAIDENKAVKFPINTLLIGCIGDIGKLGITTSECSSNQQITGILLKDYVNVNYLYYWFYGHKDILENTANNAVVPILNNRSLEKIKIPLPSLETQKKIAEILDAADTLRQKTKTLIEKYDQLTQSLFLDMFGDPVTNPKDFDIVKIRDLIIEAKYGTSSKSQEHGEYPYLRMNNITYTGYMNYSDMKYIDIKDSDKQKYIVKKGDIVFNRTNSKDLVGKTGLITNDGEMVIAGYLIRLRTNTLANPYYLWGHLNSKWAKTNLKNMCKNIIGMANINAQELQGIKILKVPLPLQNQFAERVKDIKDQKTKAQASFEKSEELFQSLLQKAFNGEID